MDNDKPISYDVHLDLTPQERAVYDTSMREYERANLLEYGNKAIKLHLAKYVQCYYCIPEGKYSNAKTLAKHLKEDHTDLEHIMLTCPICAEPLTLL